MNDQFGHNQCTISYRLLKLLQWLVEYEQEPLKKLIIKALAHGLDTSDNIALATKQQSDLEEELQQSVVDFFALLETLLAEVVHEESVKQTMQRQLIPALDQIDSSLCDSATLASSIAKATSSNKPQENIKQVLFKELLKRWKPHKKPYAH